jgi:hypothetical protein
MYLVSDGQGGNKSTFRLIEEGGSRGSKYKSPAEIEAQKLGSKQQLQLEMFGNYYRIGLKLYEQLSDLLERKLGQRTTVKKEHLSPPLPYSHQRASQAQSHVFL